MMGDFTEDGVADEELRQARSRFDMRRSSLK